MKKAGRDIPILYRDAIVNSYSQLFFANNKWLAVLLLAASFVDFYTGFSGLLAVVCSILPARWLRFDPFVLRSGAYTYNSLLVGLAMGVHFSYNLQFFAMLFLISVLTLFITISFINLSARLAIPFLSIPFVIGVWLLLLSTRSFEAMGLSQRGIYTINELWSVGGPALVELYEKTDSFVIPHVFIVYLKSLGSIFFQYSLLAGLIIAAGLLMFSRISFMLSLAGFLTGYFFYQFLQGNTNELEYSFIGFNFILSAIAIGGFFLVPSLQSFLLAILCSPLIAIIISALEGVMGIYQLPLYSLPFSLMVMLLLFVLRLRYEPGKPELVLLQQFSPEKNLYKHITRKERFHNDTYFHIHPPYFGEWSVSQAHEGEHTHREDWRYAWDFVVTDEHQKTFRLPGTDLNDFYCYSLPVLSPAAGYVVEVTDGLDDNLVGDMNLERNWGNSIVIKHGDYLFSQLSHLRSGSIRVRPGDYVKKGDMLATCGNSGRSPEPHIHFQLQATPFIGSKTLRYPLSYYVSRQDDGFSFHAFDYPVQGQRISRIATTTLLREAFHFIPGRKIKFETTGPNAKKQMHEWEVFTDAWNQSYIYCHTTRSTAWFVNNETLHYFTDFDGDRNSLLYYFYLGAHKVLMGYYDQMKLNDLLPLEGFYSGVLKYVQDFVAPFHLFLQSKFEMQFTQIDDLMHPGEIHIRSAAQACIGRHVKRQINFELVLKENMIHSFTVTENGKQTLALCIS